MEASDAHSTSSESLQKTDSTISNDQIYMLIDQNKKKYEKLKIKYSESLNQITDKNQLIRDWTRKYDEMELRNMENEKKVQQLEQCLSTHDYCQMLEKNMESLMEVVRTLRKDLDLSKLQNAKDKLEIYETQEENQKLEAEVNALRKEVLESKLSEQSELSKVNETLNMKVESLKIEEGVSVGNSDIVKPIEDSIEAKNKQIERLTNQLETIQKIIQMGSLEKSKNDIDGESTSSAKSGVSAQWDRMSDNDAS